ncbi:MAG: hypothetical protein CMF50_00840 [Legionellales bacterium]|nr:hypothetical protein [Legionellales bacterium]|tara:strand:- start:39117 stop:39485 length:369 start_codon:yes stop_codon:yes gene_type:complete
MKKLLTAIAATSVLALGVGTVVAETDKNLEIHGSIWNQGDVPVKLKHNVKGFPEMINPHSKVYYVVPRDKYSVVYQAENNPNLGCNYMFNVQMGVLYITAIPTDTKSKCDYTGHHLALSVTS